MYMTNAMKITLTMMVKKTRVRAPSSFVKGMITRDARKKKKAILNANRPVSGSNLGSSIRIDDTQPFY